LNKPDANIDTPKAMGEPVTKGTVLHNGDGLCYIDKGKLVGFRVNNASSFRPQRGIQYYRNQDTEWDKMLSKPSAERKIAVNIDVYEDHITMTDEDGLTASVDIEEKFELARTHQKENIERQLSKLGDTIFEAQQVNILMTKNHFIPSSLLSQWRRTLSDALTTERRRFYPLERQVHSPISIEAEKPYELTHDKATPVMISKYCIRRQLGMCLKERNSPRKEALSLKLANGTSFPLDFDCKNCMMKLFLP
jgi:putative protease